MDWLYHFSWSISIRPGFGYNLGAERGDCEILQIVAFCVTYAAEPSNTLLTARHACLQ